MSAYVFDDAIELIKKRYNLFFEDTELRYLNMRTDCVEECICDLIRTFGYERIAFRSAAETTKRLLTRICDINDGDYDIVGIFDRNTATEKVCGYSVYPIEQINEINPDCVIITSFAHRTDMKAELRDLNYAGRVVDIYDHLAENGYFFDASYWAWTDPRVYYLHINHIKNRYYSEKDTNIKEIYLRKLIGCYLNIRDFVDLKKYVGEYNRLFNDGLNNLIGDIENVLNDVKQALADRKHRTIAMFWIDQLKYTDVERMTFLKNYGEDSVFFERCYTQNLQTSTTFKMMFSGKDVLDDKSYLIDTIRSDNSIVYRELVENDFDFRYIGWGKNNVYFDGISNYSLERDNCFVSLNAWNMIMDTINNNGDHFYLMHSFEVHEHHWCGEMSDALYDIHKVTFDQFKTRYYECVDYVDKQLEFYLTFIGDDCDVIVMSDHGQELENVFLFDENNNPYCKKYKLGRWSDSSLHTVMILHSLAFEKKHIEGFFNLVDFVEIVRSLLKKKWMVQERAYSKIQSMPFYSLSGLKKIYATDNLKYAMLVKGIITKEAKFLEYADGTEEYYLGDNETDNHICDPELEKKIEECRFICGPVDYSIFDIPKYKNAKIALEKYKEGER